VPMWKRMNLKAIKAKIAQGVLPHVNGIAVGHVRYASGVCVGCDAALDADDIGVQFDSDSGKRLLHVDCYVMWTEACAD
jgi:hypothetical protein